MTYETVIGLEVHVELHTHSKIFCGCSTHFGAEPNHQTCPICLGHPGVLPVVNQKAVELAVKAALALNCDIARHTKFDRKNYFYPDNSKAYQISQYDEPVGSNGWIDIEIDGETKRIGIERVHLEEDAGKLTHMSSGISSTVDFNRAGTPLIEIVSKPELSTPEEAKLYLEKIKEIMLYCEVSDVKMEEGSLRCDANISLRVKGATELGTKAELKNMNSFRGVQSGLEYEEERQADVLNSGEKVIQQTRRWDESSGKTIAMRSKEQAHDYRYFPDPDLPELTLEDAWIESIRLTIPELPDARRKKYVEQYGLSSYDAKVLTSSKQLSDLLEESLNIFPDAKLTANWIMGEILSFLNIQKEEHLKITGKQLGNMLLMIQKGTINNKIAKQVLKEVWETGLDPDTIVEKQGLTQISNEEEIEKIVLETMQKNPQSIADYKAGKQKALGFIVGQVMKITKGKANPDLVNQILIRKIDE